VFKFIYIITILTKKKDSCLIATKVIIFFDMSKKITFIKYYISYFSKRQILINSSIEKKIKTIFLNS
jgi:hypothetical protein